MKSQPISNELALRIGLASRCLPDISPATLMQILVDLFDLPLTKKKFSRLTTANFKNAKGHALSNVDDDTLNEAITILTTDQSEVEPEVLPIVNEYEDGDMPDSIRIACASNKGEENDGHFGSCKRFLIYQVSRSEIRLIEIRTTKMTDKDSHEDKNAWRADLIRDCQVLFTGSIGGPAAAKVVRAGIHPIKRPDGGSALLAIAEIQSRLDDTAPPWLAKVMGKSPEERIRFDREEATG